MKVLHNEAIGDASPKKVLKCAISIATKVANELSDPRVKMKDIERAKRLGKNRPVPKRRGRKCQYPLSNFLAAMLYRWYYGSNYRDTSKELRKMKFKCPDYTYLDKVRGVIPNKLFVKCCRELQNCMQVGIGSRKL